MAMGSPMPPVPGMPNMPLPWANPTPMVSPWLSVRVDGLKFEYQLTEDDVRKAPLHHVLMTFWWILVDFHGFLRDFRWFSMLLSLSWLLRRTSSTLLTCFEVLKRSSRATATLCW